MVKGVYILKSHLDAIVCLSDLMAFAGKKTATPSSAAERLIDQTQYDERVKSTIGVRPQMDGPIELGLFNVKVPQEKEPLYGEVKTVQLNGLTTDIVGTGFGGGAQISNRMFVNVPHTKNRNLRKAVWNTLRDVEMLPKDTLHVHAKDGVLTLSGLVETATQKAAAGKTAQSVPGVKKVINIIHVGMLSIQTEQD